MFLEAARVLSRRRSFLMSIGARALLTSLIFGSFPTVAQPLDTPVIESREKRKNEQAPRPGHRDVQWNLEFGSEFEAEGRDESLAIVTGLGMELRFEFTQNLRLVLAPNARFYSARSQERFDSDNFEDRINLREAFLQYQPLPVLNIKAGSISQGSIDQPQLLSNHRSFPAILIQAEGGSESLTASAFLQESVPTSYSYNAQREDKEALPGLRSLRASLTSVPLTDWQMELAVGRLSWRNLPSKVAFNSQKLGNSPFGEFAPGSRFVTGFETDFLGAEVNYCLECRYGVSGSYSRAHNSQAPGDSADAQLMGVAVHYRMPTLITSLAVDDFFSESDVTPAVYASSSFGNTNRRGQRLRLEFEVPSKDIKIKTEWVKANVIAGTPFQSDLNYVYLGVETHGQFLQ